MKASILGKQDPRYAVIGEGYVTAGSSPSGWTSAQISELLSCSPDPSASESAEAVVKAIGEQLTRICELQFGHALRSVILTGSLARGEGSFARHNESWQSLSDAEFILVLSDSTRLPSADEQGTIRKRISNALSERGLSCTLSLALVHADFLRKLRPSIFAYELRICGQCLAGDLDILTLIPAFSVSDIPLEDGWRLLCNRMIEQLESVAGLESDSCQVSSQLLYRTVKLYLDMATSLLLFLGAYEPTYRMRAQRLKSLRHHSRSGAVPFDIVQFARTVDICTHWKLGLTTKPTAGSTWNLWLSSQRDATHLLHWELSRLTDCVAVQPDLTKKWMRSQQLNARLRGWAYVLRERGWFRSSRQWPRWLRCAAQGSPRYLVYAAACEIYVRLPAFLSHELDDSQGERLLKQIENRLPVVNVEPRMSQMNPQNSRGPFRSIRPVSKAPPAAAADWRQLASKIVWNYHEFLVPTRS